MKKQSKSLKSKTKEASKNISCPVIKGKVLGVNVYRGYLKLSALSQISEADIYDKKSNPKGTQRDLKTKHAKDAYEYVKNADFGFWPEVFLCARKNNILTFEALSDSYPQVGVLEFDIETILKSGDVLISRVDGNHRLHFGNSNEKGYKPIDKEVSFCIAYNLSLEEEIKLFKDINQNQKPMNTSHLDGIEVRLSAEEELKRRQPDLYIAQKLGTDKSSPFFDRVYDGGKKPQGSDMPLRSIKTGIKYMFSRSKQLPRLDDTDGQFKVIKNYFNAVKSWCPEAWSKPKEYLMLRGVGFWAVCYLGAEVIDRGLVNGEFNKKNFLDILKSGKSWDWSNKGDFKGYSGAQGAQEIAKKIARHLEDKSQMSTDELLKKIMSSS